MVKARRRRKMAIRKSYFGSTTEEFVRETARRLEEIAKIEAAIDHTLADNYDLLAKEKGLPIQVDVGRNFRVGDVNDLLLLKQNFEAVGWTFKWITNEDGNDCIELS